jgi:hypothetical protein
MNKTKRIFAIVLLAILAMTVVMLAGCTPSDKGAESHTHTLTRVAPKAATCMDDGNREYYVCDLCDEAFVDAEGTMPLYSEKYVIPAKGHNVASHSEKEATCTTEGIKEHYECRNCGLLFRDAEGMFVINQPAHTPTLDHVLTYVAEKLPVGFTAGWLEHYFCPGCDRIYTDALGLVETTMEQIKLTPVITDFEYKIAFTFGATIDSNPYITAKYVDGVNGLPATEFTFAAGATAGTQAYAWIHSQVNGAMSQGHNLRIPTFSGRERELEMNFTNNGTEPISFRYFAENNGDKGGIEITVAAGETKNVKFKVNPGTSIGCNYALKLLSGLSSETKLVVNGFFHCEGEVDSISLYKTAKKTTFKVGETFSADGVVVKAHGNGYDEVVIANFMTDLDGHVFTASDVGTRTVTVAYGEYTVTYEIEIKA